MFEHVLLILFKSKILCNNSLAILSAVHPLFQHLLNSFRRHEKFDISALKRIDKNWSIQTTIPYVKKLNFLACAIHFDFCIPDVIRYIRGKYTGEDRNIPELLANIKPYVPQSTYNEVYRALTLGAPTWLHGISSREKCWTIGVMVTMLLSS